MADNVTNDPNDDGVLFKGFGFSGFRNFTGEMNYFGPLKRINLVVGPNNSGKSNVLRAVEWFLGQVRSRRGLDVELQRFSGPDVPSPRRGDGLTIAFPSVPATLPSNPTASFDGILQRVLPQFGSGGFWNYFWPEQLAQVLTSESLEKLSEGEKETVWLALNRYRGTPSIEVARSLRTFLANGMIRPGVIDPKRIDSNRSLKPLGHADDNSGGGLLRLLHVWCSPPAEIYDVEKAKFDRLTSFVRSVTGIDSLSMYIQHDGQQLVVQAHGRSLTLKDLGRGIEETVVLAAMATQYKKSLVLIEEPETGLHPGLQRSLLRFLIDNTDNQYIITTHSAAIIESVFNEAAIFQVSQGADGWSHLKLRDCTVFGVTVVI